MNVAALRAEAPETVESNIALLMETDPGIVIRDPAKWDLLRERIKADIVAQVPNLDTKKGREEIRSLAADVTRSKTAVDKARKKMTEEYRLKTAEVNKIGGEIVDTLDSLAELARRPLTQWEEAEKERERKVKETQDSLRSVLILPMGATADDIAQRLAVVDAMRFDPGFFGHDLDYTEQLHRQAVVTLQDMHRRAEQEEADRAELARLREADDKRKQEEAARLAVEEAERRAAEAKAEQERREQQAAANAAREAEEKAKREAEQALAEERRKHQAELDRIENERRAEADKAAKAKADEEAAALRQKREDELRAANVAHRSKVMGESKQDLMTHIGLDEETAKKIVRAISAGSISHISISF